MNLKKEMNMVLKEITTTDTNVASNQYYKDFIQVANDKGFDAKLLWDYYELNYLNAIEEARKKVETLNNVDIMCAFDMIGFEYLQNETVYYNSDLCDAFSDFEIYDLKEILDYIINNENYNTTDKYIIFDGFSLISMNDLEYCKQMIYDKMDNNTARFILDSE